MPGTVISALHVAIEDARDGAEPDLAQVKSHFEGMRLVGSRPQNGDAQVWTSFQVHSDGCGRMMVFNRGMSNSQLGRMVQRLIEIETYRLMALMGLPLARYYNQKLAKRDKQLAEITAQLSETEEEVDEQEVLAKIIRMAAWVEAARAKTTFRFSATAAYHDLVLKRLSELKEDEVSGHLTVTDAFPSPKFTSSTIPTARAVRTPVASRRKELFIGWNATTRPMRRCASTIGCSRTKTPTVTKTATSWNF